jgi:hypothetical protein
MRIISTGEIGVGNAITPASNVMIQATRTTNNSVSIGVTNAQNGTAGVESVSATSDVGAVVITAFSSGYTTSGSAIASAGRLESSSGLSAGLSYAACKTYCILHNINFNAENSVEVFKTAKNKVHDEYFLPSASCGFIMQDAQKKGTWVYKHDVTDRSKIQPGWLVLYNWKGGTWPDHIGIVEQNKLM